MSETSPIWPFRRKCKINREIYKPLPPGLTSISTLLAIIQCDTKPAKTMAACCRLGQTISSNHGDDLLPSDLIWILLHYTCFNLNTTRNNMENQRDKVIKVRLVCFFFTLKLILSLRLDRCLTTSHVATFKP